MTETPAEITQLLVAWGGGDQAALDQLMPLVYDELRRRAHRYMEREHVGHTLQTSALVNEAYLKLVDQRAVMIRRDGYVKVLDFGLAKLTDVGPRPGQISPDSSVNTLLKTAPGMVMGTPYYMSPEQARGLEVDARSDIWSLGCVLFEMVTGRMAFEGATTSDIIAAILQKEPPPVGQSAPEIPAELDRIVRKALSKDREERYQVMKDLASDLKRLKKQLEFAAELARTAPPEGRSGEPRATATTGSHGAAATVRAAAAQTADQAVAGATSSAEYIVNEIKRHKPGVAISLIALIAMAAAAYLYLAPGSKGQINSIVVLPFANTSGDPNMEYLSDGISEALINALSQLPGVKVIARGSSFKYKGKEVDPEEVARALGVQAIVSGRVAQRGDNLQVSAELVNALDKTQMWGEQFHRKAADVLQVQAEISRRIVEKLRLRLTNTEQQQLVKGAQANAQAYELYLKGRFHRSKRTANDLKKAVEYYNQAIAIDPNYALAHAVLAEAYRYMGANGYLDPKEMTPKAEAAAKRALELDENLPQAHAALAGIKKDAFDWAGAERAYKRAIELNPNLATVHSGYAYYLSTQRRHEQALAESKQARELDPLAVAYRANIGHILYFARQYDLAIEQLKQTIELDRNYEYTHVVLGYVYAAKGQYAEALAEYKETSRLGGIRPVSNVIWAMRWRRWGSAAKQKRSSSSWR